MTDYDVIVVGSGAAGLTAALSARRRGMRVLLVEGQPDTGGSSKLSGGHFYAAGTSLQAEAGVQDSADAMFEHYMTLNQWDVEPGIVRRYCDASAPTFEWLCGLGVQFAKEGVYRSGVGSTPRGHVPSGGGAAVVEVLEGHLSETGGVDVVCNARVTALVQRDDGSIEGVAIGDDVATSHAVILATGGFGANEEMIERYYPDAHATGSWRWYIGGDGAQGDGLRLGQEAGGAISGRNRGLLLVTPGFSRDLEVMLPNWLVLINADGQRFVNESAPYSVLAGLLLAQNGPVYAVFDEAALANARPTPVSQAYWVTDTLRREVASGRIVCADSIRELAEQLNIPVAAMEGSVARYNADVGAGTDRAFMKPPPLFAIDAAPFYAAEVRPAIVCWTGTGLRIDESCRVLTERQLPIAGLFAAGETVGNLHGDRYIGGGGSFGPCIVFGKIAGEQAAEYVQALNEA